MVQKLQLFFFLLSSTFLLGQSFTGLTQDNYAGIHGVIVNPANVQGSPYKTDINLFSVSVLAGTDAFDVDFDKLLNDDDYDLFDDDSAKMFNENNNAYVNLDILGPSFMFNLSKKSSIAITTRVRGIANVNEIKGQLIDEVEGIDEDLNESFEVTEDKTYNTANTWAEFGITYGREILSLERHKLRAAITAKYLLGRGAVVGEAEDLTVAYDAGVEGIDGDEEFSARGSASYAYTESLNPDEEDYDFSDTGKGVGFDIGFVYELKKKKQDTTLANIYKRDYLIKVGLAITDIGKISYDGATRENYDFGNTTINRDAFLDQDIFETIEDLTEPEFTTEDLEIKLPTALRLNVDLQATKRLYVNAGINQSLRSTNEKSTNRIYSEYYVAPRFQTKWLTLGTTLMSRQHLGFAWGANLRLGPLIVGSSTLLSGLGDASQQADVYVGLKIPVYKRLKEKK